MTDAAMDNSPPPQATIEINLGKLQQLFNSLDPSPFHERDLDHEAGEYIVARAEEIGLHSPLKLVIHLPQEQLASAIRCGNGVGNSRRRRAYRRLGGDVATAGHDADAPAVKQEEEEVWGRDKWR